MAMYNGGILPPTVIGAILFASHLAGGSIVLPPNGTLVAFDDQGVATTPVDIPTLLGAREVPHIDVHEYLHEPVVSEDATIADLEAVGVLSNGLKIGVIDFTDRPVTVRLPTGETTTGYFVAWSDEVTGISIPASPKSVERPVMTSDIESLLSKVEELATNSTASAVVPTETIVRVPAPETSVPASVSAGEEANAEAASTPNTPAVEAKVETSAETGEGAPKDAEPVKRRKKTTPAAHGEQEEVDNEDAVAVLRSLVETTTATAMGEASE